MKIRELRSIFQRPKAIRFSIISSAITIFFILLILGAYKASRTPSDKPKVALSSNGSSDFAPTTILISLDGFRADFLDRGLTPTLNRFITEGVSPKYMLPSFPSVTFPNHYTLVTGLYPESHGVVGNSFWDPELEEEFFYTDPARSMQPKWWLGGEPLWVTAEQQNVRTAIHMWPGSEAHITLEPTYLDKYNGTEVLFRKVDRILGLLDKPNSGHGMASNQRPQFIAAYVPVVDADGHLHGPNSTEIRDTIANVDIMLQQLFGGLDERNLTNIVNIVVVSDHGMATTSTNRLIQLDDLIDLDLVEHIDGWPLYGIRPKDPTNLRPLYDQLIAESIKNPNFEVYLRDENMPERYHFAKNNRIAPLWIIPRTGWAIVRKKDFDVEAAKSAGQVYHPKGLHGYDHEHPLMRAIFIARGPAFPHKPNSRLEAFRKLSQFSDKMMDHELIRISSIENTEVYNIICDSLFIKSKPNNGTLRLPLRPIGLHSDESDTLNDLPVDLPSDSESLATAMAADSTNGSKDSSAIVGPSNNTGNPDENLDDDKPLSKLWAWLVAKAEAARIWSTNALKAGKEHALSSEQDDESQPP